MLLEQTVSRVLPSSEFISLSSGPHADGLMGGESFPFLVREYQRGVWEYQRGVWDSRVKKRSGTFFVLLLLLHWWPSAPTNPFNLNLASLAGVGVLGGRSDGEICE